MRQTKYYIELYKIISLLYQLNNLVRYNELINKLNERKSLTSVLYSLSISLSLPTRSLSYLLLNIYLPYIYLF